MSEVTVSPKYQIVIPKAVREALGITPGQKVQMVACDNRIEVVPLKSMAEMRGFLAGIDVEVDREDDRV